MIETGAKIVMACRDTAKAKKTADEIEKSFEGVPDVGKLVVRELDLGSFKSVRKCANEILQSEPAIHLLVNNAGESPTR